MFRLRWPVIAVVGAMTAAIAAVVYILFLQAPGDVSNPNVEFNASGAAHRRAPSEHFVWPFYGYDPQHTRYLNVSLAPPFKPPLWQFVADGLLEFQPVLANGHLYLVSNAGTAYSLSTRTGQVEWRRRVASLNASAPAWSNGRLYIATLSK